MHASVKFFNGRVKDVKNPWIYSHICYFEVRHHGAWNSTLKVMCSSKQELQHTGSGSTAENGNPMNGPADRFNQILK